MEIQNETRKNKLPVNDRNNRGYADANALPKDAISIPISIPISKIDFKRLIDACVSENSRADARLVEIGVLYTLLQRAGSRDPINSLAYFAPQIKRICTESKGMGSKAIDALLATRRQQYEPQLA